jgi:hypothetical protein
MEFLSEYDFDIKHIKGKEKKLVDALRKSVHIMHATTISMHSSYLKRGILDGRSLKVLCFGSFPRILSV